MYASTYRVTSQSCVPKGRLAYWERRPISCFRLRAARGAAPELRLDRTGCRT